MRKFRRFLTKTFGSLPLAFEAMDANKSGQLSLAGGPSARGGVPRPRGLARGLGLTGRGGRRGREGGGGVKNLVGSSWAT